MSYALIDNASLTAVQRFLGKITITNTDTINGDLVALENFLQAILFYDELICIDNYKPEFREERKKEFDFIRFLSEEDYNLSEIDKIAKEEARQINPEIRGGEFVNEDFKVLIEQLKLNIVCTWDLASSVYYLTLKMLGQPYSPEFAKYSEISASIFSELSDLTGTQKGYWSKELKNSSLFTEVRGILREIHKAYDEDGIASGNKKVTKLLSDLEQACGNIKRSYGLPTTQGISTSFLIKCVNCFTSVKLGLALPEVEKTIPIPKFMQNHNQKVFSNVFKDLTHELTNTERLGSLRTQLGSSFVIDDKFYSAPKVEKPEFRWFASDWKKPM